MIVVTCHESVGSELAGSVVLRTTLFYSTYIYLTAPIAFYAVVCILAIEHLHELRADMTEIVTNTLRLPKKVHIEIHLKKWKRQYLRLTQLVDSMNEVFSCSLLIITIAAFVIIMNGVFFSTILIEMNLPILSVLNFYHVFRFVVYILITMYLSSRICNEVGGSSFSGISK